MVLSYILTVHIALLLPGALSHQKYLRIPLLSCRDYATEAEKTRICR